MYWKKKRSSFFSSPSFPCFRPASQFPGSRRPSSPPLWHNRPRPVPLGPASRIGPARPSNRRPSTVRLTAPRACSPRPAADRPAPPVSASPTSAPRPSCAETVAAATAAAPGVVGASPRTRPLQKGAVTPCAPLLPIPAPISHSHEPWTPKTTAPRIAGIRRPPLRANRRPRAAFVPD